jgi:hypothetical protein
MTGLVFARAMGMMNYKGADLVKLHRDYEARATAAAAAAATAAAGAADGDSPIIVDSAAEGTTADGQDGAAKGAAGVLSQRTLLPPPS